MDSIKMELFYFYETTHYRSGNHMYAYKRIFEKDMYDDEYNYVKTITYKNGIFEDENNELFEEHAPFYFEIKIKIPETGYCLNLIENKKMLHEYYFLNIDSFKNIYFRVFYEIFNRMPLKIIKYTSSYNPIYEEQETPNIIKNMEKILPDKILNRITFKIKKNYKYFIFIIDSFGNQKLLEIL